MKRRTASRSRSRRPAPAWHVYILKCGNGALYTGITNDLDRRLKAHRVGKGAKFTRAFKVKKLLYSERCRTRSKALKREAQIKSWPRAEKLALVKALPGRNDH